LDLATSIIGKSATGDEQHRFSNLSEVLVARDWLYNLSVADDLHGTSTQQLQMTLGMAATQSSISGTADAPVDDTDIHGQYYTTDDDTHVGIFCCNFCRE
jgi:hypothetical protein